VSLRGAVLATTPALARSASEQSLEGQFLPLKQETASLSFDFAGERSAQDGSQ